MNAFLRTFPAWLPVARKEMRTKFLKADMGISGANMAVAETGTLTIVTNEGNARLVTSLPRIHCGRGRY